MTTTASRDGRARRLPGWLPPAHEDPERALRARVVHWVLITAIVVLVVLAVLLAALPIYGRDPYTLPVFGASLVAALAAFPSAVGVDTWPRGLTRGRT